MLISLDTDMTPQMGFWGLLMAVVATIIGGVGKPFGALAGALCTAAIQQVGIWYLPSRWNEAVVFGVLFLILIFRPQGLFGLRVRKATV